MDLVVAWVKLVAMWVFVDGYVGFWWLCGCCGMMELAGGGWVVSGQWECN